MLLSQGSKIFVGKHPQVLSVLDMVNRIADTDATVLITGESGTGKEIIAQMLHEKSSRRTNSFIAVNCGAIAETLQESELFGHVRGAFTGAMAPRVGKFEAAHGGTIFLDEISEISKALQVKLLRILQSGEYAPVGIAENRFCDVRVVAATNQDLQPLIEDGRFRQDLYYRLNIIRLEIPPLREHKEDIPLLIDHFLKMFKDAYQRPELQINREAEELLMQYDYPGNVRELENIVRRAIILCSDKCISPDYLPREVLSPRFASTQSEPPTFHQAKAQVVEEFEREYLASMLRDCGGIASRAAQRSGLSERNFYEKLKRYGIHSTTFRVACTTHRIVGSQDGTH